MCRERFFRWDRRRPVGTAYTFEGHYVYSPQLIFIGRYEAERMSQQANGPTSANPSASNLGNISTYTIGFRYNPFMTSRAGLAWHNEYNWLHQDGDGTDSWSWDRQHQHQRIADGT